MPLRLRQRWLAFRNRLLPHIPPVETTPYVVHYTAPVTFDIRSIELAQYPGLLAVEGFGGDAPNPNHLTIVWRNRDAYHAQRLQFCATTQLGPPVWERLYVGTRRPVVSRWRRVLSWKGIGWVFASILALVGYAEDLRDASGWLIGDPQIQVERNTKTIDVLQHDSFTIEGGVRNIRWLGDCQIRFAELDAEPASGITLEPLPNKVNTAIGPNEVARAPVVGEAVVPGLYNVFLRGDATYGWISTTKPYRGLLGRVRVWSPLPTAKALSIHDVSENHQQCEVVCELLTGRASPKGLSAIALIKLEPNLRLSRVVYTDVLTWDPPFHDNTPDAEVTRIRWAIPEARAFQQTSFRLVLVDTSGQGKSRAEWQRIVDKIAIQVDQPVGTKE